MTIEHFIRPEFVPEFRRYQCKACKRWIRYDDYLGRWLHPGDS